MKAQVFTSVEGDGVAFIDDNDFVDVKLRKAMDNEVVELYAPSEDSVVVWSGIMGKNVLVNMVVTDEYESSDRASLITWLSERLHEMKMSPMKAVK